MILLTFFILVVGSRGWAPFVVGLRMWIVAYQLRKSTLLTEYTLKGRAVVLTNLASRASWSPSCSAPFQGIAADGRERA
jgi:hypothetical protein